MKRQSSFWLLSQRKPRCSFLQSIQVHLIPAFIMLLQFDPNEIKAIQLRCTGGEVGAMSALAPEISAWALSPKKVDAIVKALSDWKGLRITVKLTMEKTGPDWWYLLPLSWSLTGELCGTIKEILQTAYSVGFNVDGSWHRWHQQWCSGMPI